MTQAWTEQQGTITADMRGLVRQYVEDAYFEGLMFGGASPDIMSDEDRALIDELTAEQLTHIAQFAKDVKDAAADAEQQAAIRQRIGLWAESIFRIGQRGWVSAQQKYKRRLQWHTVGPDELTCPICAPLHDKIVEAGKEFAPGIYNEPAHPNCRCTTTEYVQPEDIA